MKTNVKLVAGGIAGFCAPILAVGGMLLWSASDPAPSASSTPSSVDTQRPSTESEEPIDSPIDHNLATVRTPAVVEPAIEEEEISPFEPELHDRGAIRVRRLVIATGIERHEPTGAADLFELGAQERIYAFVDAVNERDESVELAVTFEPERGETSGHVDLEIPAHARRWRTWAYTRHVYTAGRWRAVVRGTDGQVLAARAFDIVD